ncbi:hypothetical protein [Nocardioides sp.]|uniref:RsiG family protein n=1 Tax=Nocardioides sp. TaxID=35761 RepID=UPI0035619247
MTSSGDHASSNRLADLDREALRRYRSALETEEDRVSYRRRLIHAQIDLLEAGLSPASKFSTEDLVRVLRDPGPGSGGRRALVRIPTETLASISDLADVLDTDPDRDDPDQVAAALATLREAERALTEHRRSVHEKLDEATQELINRYRDDPRAALSVIPSER